MFRWLGCANRRAGRSRTIWRCAPPSARRRSRFRASCCSPRAHRSAAGPTWSRPPIRWRRTPASYRPEQARLHVEHGRSEAVSVGKYLAHQRERGQPGGGNLAYHAREVEAQLGLVLAGELLHALVVGEARHVQEFDAAVARGEQRALEQHGAYAVALPRLLDGEGGLRLPHQRRTERTQLGRAAQRAVDEEAVDERIDAERKLGIVAHELVGHGAGEAVAPAVGIETQQVVAIGVGFADPQFADHGAVGQRVAHRSTPSIVVALAKPPRDFANQPLILQCNNDRATTPTSL